VIDKMVVLIGGVFALLLVASAIGFVLARRWPSDTVANLNARIKAWWAKNSARFQSGRRYFMGAPVTREHCIDVLKNGYQRQRILAAHYLCLLEPGTPLFNTSAPAWRQQRQLAAM